MKTTKNGNRLRKIEGYCRKQGQDSAIGLSSMSLLMEVVAANETSSTDIAITDVCFRDLLS